MIQRLLVAAALVALSTAPALAGQASARMDAPTISLFDLRPDDGIAPAYTHRPEYVEIWQPRSRSYDFSDGGGIGNYVSAYEVNASSNGHGSIGFIFSNEQNQAFLLTPYTTVRITTQASIAIDLQPGELGWANASLSITDWSDGDPRSRSDGIDLSFSDGASTGGRRDGTLTLEFSTGAKAALFTWDTEVDVEVDARGIVAPPVPEPGTYALMLAGVVAVGWVTRRRRGMLAARAACEPAA